MAAIGQFPKKRRFRGKKIGWLKADILEWMAITTGFRVAIPLAKTNGRRRHGSRSPGQTALPLEFAKARAYVGRRALSSIAGVSS
jgi:hypothetical protein